MADEAVADADWALAARLIGLKASGSAMCEETPGTLVQRATRQQQQQQQQQHLHQHHLRLGRVSVASQDVAGDTAVLRRHALRLRQCLRAVHLAPVTHASYTAPGVVLAYLYAVLAVFARMRSLTLKLDGPADPLCLADALQQPASLVLLELEANRALPPWRVARFLAALLPRTPRLRALRLSMIGHMDIGPISTLLCDTSLAPRLAALSVVVATSDALGLVARVARVRAQHMRYLNLVHLGVDDAGSDDFGAGATSLAALGSCTRLQHLLLPSGVKTSTSADALIASIQRLPYLQQLELPGSYNYTGVSTLQPQALASALAQCPALVRLVLRACSLRPQHGVLLGKVLSALPLLQHLDVSRNTLGDEGICAMAQVLPRLQLLQQLMLSGNRQTERGDVAVVRAVTALPLLRHVTMPATAAATLVFASTALQVLPHLTRVNLATFSGDAEEETAILTQLVQHLPHLGNLVSIRLRIGTPPPALVYAVVAAAVQTKPKLTSLSIALPLMCTDTRYGDALTSGMHCLPHGAPLLAELLVMGVAFTTAAVANLLETLQRHHSRGSALKDVRLVNRRHATLLPPIAVAVRFPLSVVMRYPLVVLQDIYQAAMADGDRSLPAPPPLSVPSLVELALHLALLTAQPLSRMPHELQPTEVRDRFQACVACRRQTDVARRGVQFMRRVWLSRLTLVQCIMCCRCFHLDWSHRQDVSRAPLSLQ